MSSRFNRLYIGSASDAEDELERTDVDAREPTTDELRLALVNALNRIAVLERSRETLSMQLAQLRLPRD